MNQEGKLRRGASFGWLVSAGILAAAAVTTLALLIAPRGTPPPPAFLSASLVSSVDFPLYYPTQLPDGYTFAADSLSTDSGVVLYLLTGPGGAKISVAIQPKPSKFDYEDFYKQKLLGTKRFTTKLGEAAVGSNYTDRKIVGSLVTASGWVLVSGDTAQVSTFQLQQIISSLTQVKTI